MQGAGALERQAGARVELERALELGLELRAGDEAAAARGEREAQWVGGAIGLLAEAAARSAASASRPQRT